MGDLGNFVIDCLIDIMGHYAGESLTYDYFTLLRDEVVVGCMMVLISTPYTRLVTISVTDDGGRYSAVARVAPYKGVCKRSEFDVEAPTLEGLASKINKAFRDIYGIAANSAAEQ